MAADRVAFRCERCGVESSRTRRTYDRARERYGRVWCQACAQDAWLEGRQVAHAAQIGVLDLPGPWSRWKARCVVAYEEWHWRPVCVVLSIAEAREMWRRAQQWDVDEGGRFDARAAVVLIWSASFTADRDRSEPMGEFSLYWRTPSEGLATIWRVGWDVKQGGSEAEVWRALAVLAGRELQP